MEWVRQPVRGIGRERRAKEQLRAIEEEAAMRMSGAMCRERGKNWKEEMRRYKITVDVGEGSEVACRFMI